MKQTIQTPFTCSRDNLTIRGISIKPDTASDAPLRPIIICHGFMGSMQTTIVYGEYLASLGYHAFCFDFCGGGHSTTSDGSFSEMTVLTEIEDLKAVIACVQNRNDVQAEQLILMGCSQGGFVSGLTASELQDEVKALILFYPALCIPDDARKGSLQFFRFDPQNIPAYIEARDLRISGEYARCMQNVNAIEEISKYNGPVLIVHGTADSIVSYQYAKDAYGAYKRRNGDILCELDLIEGAEHGFKDAYREEAKIIVAKFLKQI